MDERSRQMASLHEQIQQAQAALAQLQREAAIGPVEDATFLGADGPVRLSELFGGRSDLVMVHNMGRSCPYCTMWADGLSGLVRHLEGRAALVVVSPDAPEVQQQVAEARGWPFRMVSSRGASGEALERALGFQLEDGARMPGYSTFHRDESGAIRHVASDFFGPGDAYNGAWHVFARLEGGAAGWQPTI